MARFRRVAVLALASSTLAPACFDERGLVDVVGPETDTETGSGAETSASASATSPGSTLTSDGSGATGGDPSTSTGSDEHDDGGASGGWADAAPTVELLVNGSAAPASIAKASTQTITAHVRDDHGLGRVELRLDDAAEPFAEVALDGGLDEVIEVGLPIYDDEFDGAHQVVAIVHDQATHATTSAPVSIHVDLPEGGSPVWEATSEAKFTSKALAVAVDSIGDVIAVGEEATSPDGTRSRIVVRKYHGETGAQLWQRYYPTVAEAPTPAGNNAARGVAVDGHDNVYVVGEVRPDGKTRQRWLGKYTHDGLLAAVDVSDALKSRGNGVVVDESGQVYVVGYQLGLSLEEVASIEAFDAGLDPLWSDAIAHAYAYDVRAYGAALDRHGDLVVVGSMRVGLTESRGLVTLYTPGGTRLWLRVPSSDVLPQDRLFSVTVTDDNEYVCVGRRKAYDDPRRLWLLRFSQDGEEIMSQPDATTRCGDLVFANDTDVCGIAHAPIGRLAMAGVGGWDTDDIQVKQTRADWAIHLWSPIFDGPDHAIDRGLAVAVDPDGYVTSAGYQTAQDAPRWWVSRRNP